MGCLISTFLMMMHLVALVVFFPALLITIPIHLMHDHSVTQKRNQKQLIEALKEIDKPRRRRRR